MLHEGTEAAIAANVSKPTEGAALDARPLPLCLGVQWTPARRSSSSCAHSFEMATYLAAGPSVSSCA